MINERKWRQLLAAARNDPAPAPPEEFEANVLRAIRREPTAARPETLSLFDPLNRWFPRIVWTAAAIIVVSLAVDYGLTVAGLPGLSSGISDLSAQWLGIADGI